MHVDIIPPLPQCLTVVLCVTAGALSFWPTCVFYPLRMWVAVYPPSAKWKVQALDAASYICLCVSVVALIGAMQNMIVDASSYKLFGGR